MRTYLLKRLLLFIPTAFGVSVVIFAMLHTIPATTLRALLLGGEEVYETATQEQIDEVREKLGLRGSLPEQYMRWLGDFSGGFRDFVAHPAIGAERMGSRIITSFELGVWR